MMTFKELIAKIKRKPIINKKLLVQASDDKIIDELLKAFVSDSLFLSEIKISSDNRWNGLVTFLRTNTKLKYIKGMPVEKLDWLKKLYRAVLENNQIIEITFRISTNYYSSEHNDLISLIKKQCVLNEILSIRKDAHSLCLNSNHKINILNSLTKTKANYRLEYLHLDDLSSDTLSEAYNIALATHMNSGNWSIECISILQANVQKIDAILEIINSVIEPICLERVDTIVRDINKARKMAKLQNPSYKNKLFLLQKAVDNNRLRFRQELFLLLSSPKMHVLLSGYNITKLIFDYIKNYNDITFTDKELKALVAKRYPVEKTVKSTIKITEIKENKEQNENQNISKKAIITAYSNQNQTNKIAICQRPSMKSVLNSYSNTRSISPVVVEIKGLLNQTYSATMVQSSPRGL